MAFAIGITAIGTVGYWRWNQVHQPPTTRLSLDATYPQMPADWHHRYINIAMDHNDPKSPRFRGFYILSSNFRSDSPVIFLLTDGQMELVTPGMDMSFFDEQLPGLSYVVIGHRGHVPTQFPEVYPDGKLNPEKAMQFYGSWQRVEDIEQVRKDMLAKGLLASDGRIMIFGASGAGVLAQQFLAKYGDKVDRALLVSTGAPDLARKSGMTFARSLEEWDPAAFADLAKTPDPALPTLAYTVFQLGRSGDGAHAKVRRIISGQAGNDSYPLRASQFSPATNWKLAQIALSLPSEDAAKVRMEELLGGDLERLPKSDFSVPLYIWSREVLKDFVGRGLSSPNISIDRSRYHGEVLVVAGYDDNVFSPTIARAIATAYPKGRLLLVPGGHRLELHRNFHHAIRRAFFLHGATSEEFMNLAQSTPAITQNPKPTVPE